MIDRIRRMLFGRPELPDRRTTPRNAPTPDPLPSTALELRATARKHRTTLQSADRILASYDLLEDLRLVRVKR